jgi:hypothetical protein
MMLNMNRDFNVHTAHGPKQPIQVLATDRVEFDALGLFFKHGGQVRLIPWSEVTALVQGSVDGDD